MIETYKVLSGIYDIYTSVSPKIPVISEYATENGHRLTVHQ